MKILSGLALGASLVISGLLTWRAESTEVSGWVSEEGGWLQNGPGGGHGPHLLPPELAAAARAGDTVRFTRVRQPDLGLNVESLNLERDGRRVERLREGAPRYFAVTGGLAVSPLLLWALALLLLQLKKS